MAYKSKYTGAEVDALLDKINNDDVGDIDSSLSTESENPVMNKVITEALNEKADTSALSTLETKVDTNKESTDNALLGLSTKVNKNEAEIQSLEKSKANTTGYYPQMAVGQADNLPDRGDVTQGFIGFRESAGAGNSIEDGTANVQELLGESLVWNQHVPENYFSTGAKNGVTFTIEDGAVVLNGTVETDFEYQVDAAQKIGIINTHKYAILGGEINKATYNMYDSALIGLHGRQNTIFAAIGTGLPTQRIYCYAGQTFTNYKIYPRLIDLTQMSGAGKEPSTIEEFNAIKNQLVGVDFNAYNEGEVLGVNIKGIKSVNDNAWDEEWESGRYATSTGLPNTDEGIRSKNRIKVLPNENYWCSAQNDIFAHFYDAEGNLITNVYGGQYNFLPIKDKQFTTPANAASMTFYVVNITTYNHDICIRLAHSGYKTDYVAHEESESSFDLTKYFPNGMHGLNGVRDSATPKKTTRRYGVVDLSSLTWNYYSSSNTSLFKANFGQIKVESAKVANILCGRYVTVDDQSWQPDKVILATPLSNGMVWIHDEEYKDNLQGFIESLGDLKLIYELATPIETEIDPQLNMNYKVWDFGTEELLTDGKSAPVLARTIYGFNATDTIRGNKVKNEEQDARLHTLESEVVRKGDYSPDNSVGFADDLVGRGESIPAEFSFRASGGKSIKDGAARVKRLKGNSVVWNQYIDTSGFTTLVSNGVHFEKQADGGIKVYTDEGGATADTTCGYFPIKQGFLGHYCAILGCPQGGGWDSYYINDGSEGFTDLGVGGIRKKTTNELAVTIWVKQSIIITTPIVFYPQFIDLTKMFQAGNEPTTIEEFYARKPIVEDEYAFNEGEVIHMTAEGIKSVGDNAWDEEWELGSINRTNGNNVSSSSRIRSKNYIRVIPNTDYYLRTNSGIYKCYYDANMNFIKSDSSASLDSLFTTDSDIYYIRFFVLDTTTYNNDIMITLVHSGWKQDTDAAYQPYWEDRLMFDQRIKDEFPDGMSKWDMAYNKDGKGYIVKGTGVVDLGDLTYVYQRPIEGTYPHGYFNTVLPNKAIGNSNLLCAKYNTIVDWASIGIRGSESSNNVYIKDSAYTDAASLKAAMAGVPLYYELAEPTIIEYDEPFNLDYRVADFGTEQAIAEQPSAPISADIIYQFNAVDMIREHEIEIAELQSVIATMQAQLASLTSNNDL